MTLIALDMESYYDKDYSLSKMTVEAYIRDPRFQVIGVSISVDGKTPQWFSGTKKETREWLVKQVDWANSFLLTHNCIFDSAIMLWHFGIRPKGFLDTLSMANALHGINESVSLKSLAERYHLPAKGTEVHNAIGMRREDFSPEQLAAYGEYCQMDVWLCRTLFDLMAPRFSKAELKAIDLTIRMFAEPVLELDLPLLEGHLVATREKQKESMTTLCGLLGTPGDEAGLKKVLNSNAQFADLLRSLGVDPPMKTSPTTGKPAYAFAKTDEEFTALLEHEDPLIQAAVAARLGNKSTIEETRTQAFIEIAQRGTFPFPIKYSGAAVSHRWSGFDINCLLPDTEVLTPSGWIRIDSLPPGARCAVWDSATEAVQFEPVGVVSRPHWGEVYIAESATGIHHNVYTPEHRIPYRKCGRRNTWKEKTAEQLSRTKMDWQMPVAGRYVNASTSQITIEQSRVLSMVQADGYVDSRGWCRLFFSKERKIERAEHLLTAAGLRYTKRTTAIGATLYVPRQADTIDFSCCKHLGPWMLELSPEALDAFVDEARFWDGHIRGDSFVWCTSVKENADWMRIAAHLTGRGTTLRLENNFGGYNKDPNAILYRVNIRPRNYVVNEASRTPLRAESYIGSVYCLTTSTGFFLCRYKESIMVTGNCQNLPRGGALRAAIKAPKGFKIVSADLSNIELRLGLWLAGQDDKVQLIRDGVDLYLDVASHIFNRSYDELVALGKKTRERTTGKIVSLASIYGTGAAKLKDTLRIVGKTKVSQEEAQRMTDIYRGTYGAVVSAWNEGKEVLDALYSGTEFGELFRPGVLRADAEGIWKPSGLLLAYPDLRWTKDPKDGKMGYTYEQKRKTRDRVYSSRVFQRSVQSLARDIICEHMLKIDKRFHVVGTVHDEIICVVADEEVEEAKAFMLEIMRTPPVWAKDLPLDAEVEASDNYGGAH